MLTISNNCSSVEVTGTKDKNLLLPRFFAVIYHLSNMNLF